MAQAKRNEKWKKDLDKLITDAKAGVQKLEEKRKQRAQQAQQVLNAGGSL